MNEAEYRYALANGHWQSAYILRKKIYSWVND